MKLWKSFVVHSPKHFNAALACFLFDFLFAGIYSEAQNKRETYLDYNLYASRSSFEISSISAATLCARI